MTHHKATRPLLTKMITQVSEILEEDMAAKYLTLVGQLQWLVTLGRFDINRKKSKAHNKDTKSHTMLAQDSFLGSLPVLPVELTKGIVG